MVCLSTVGFALPVIVVLEFDSACWAVCDARGLCAGEYLFSELFVFPGACSAHLLFSSLLCVCVRWWRVAASARRAPPPSNTTLSCSLFSSFSSRFFSSFLFWNGGCRVVRAQPCEHARNTTVALVCSGFVYSVQCVLLLPQHSACCPHHTLFVVNGNSAQH